MTNAESSVAGLAETSRVRQLARLAHRAAYATLLAFAATVVGWVFGDRIFRWIAKNEDLLPFGLKPATAGVTLTLALLLSNAKQIVLSVHKFWSYIREGAAPTLYPDGVQIVFVALSLHLAYLIPKAPKPEAQELFSPSVHFVEREPSSGPIAIPAFRFARARWDWSRGQLVDDFEIPSETTDRLVEFLQGLVTTCGRPCGGVITLQAEGFASDLSFKNKSKTESRELNRQAANRRAVVADKVLRHALKLAKVGDRVTILAPMDWQSFDEMTASRDRYFSPASFRDAEDSHRVAVLVIESNAGCDILREIPGRFGTAVRQPGKRDVGAEARVAWQRP